MVPFAVNVLAVARPLALVVAVVVVVVPNLPEAPEEGAVKVTVTPETGLPTASVTSATSGLAKAAFSAADCPEPEETATLAGLPTMTVNELLVAEV
jgi:hypothetical protein